MTIQRDVAAHAELTTDLAERAVQAGEKDLAIELFRFGEVLRQWAAGARALQIRNQSGSLRDMVTAERVRHSQGAGDDPLTVAANAAHFTLRSLAERVGVSHATLSLARKGERSIKRTLAEKIQELTGFAATKHNWPKLKG